MFARDRIRFNNFPSDDAAAKLFKSANSLNVSLSRGCVGRNGTAYKPFIAFELVGNIEEPHEQLLDTISNLMESFANLPPINNECSGDDCYGE